MGADLDTGALQELELVRERLRASWVSGTNEILQQRNPELLAELNRLEAVIDSLLIIPVKPAALRRQWQEALSQYEKTAGLCVTYAKRHTQIKGEVS